jgi:hypothetical protein
MNLFYAPGCMLCDARTCNMQKSKKLSILSIVYVNSLKYRYLYHRQLVDSVDKRYFHWPQ